MKKTVSSLYIHFPFCKHLCNYCDFYKKIPTSVQEVMEYGDKIKNHLQIHHDFLVKNNYELAPLETLYIGGGTPSLWSGEGIKLFKELFSQKVVKLNENCEFTIEMNPGSILENDLNQWKSVGVNRLSLGLQTLNPNLLKNLDRIHSIDDSYNAIEKLSSEKFNYSVDLMLGLPNSQKYKRNVIKELEDLLKYNPSHFSVYILTVKKNYIHYNSLPVENWIEEEYLEVSEYLRGKGFNHYEVSNFSKPGLESRHNLKYWKAESVGAIGPSATGYLDEGIRYKFRPNDTLNIEQLNNSEKRLEKIYLKLRTNLGLSLRDDFNKNESVYDLAKDWKKQGLAQGDGNKIFLTPRGYLQMDSLVNQLFQKELL